MPDVQKESVESIENLPPRREETHTHTYAHIYAQGFVFPPSDPHSQLCTNDMLTMNFSNRSTNVF